MIQRASSAANEYSANSQDLQLNKCNIFRLDVDKTGVNIPEKPLEMDNAGTWVWLIQLKMLTSKLCKSQATEFLIAKYNQITINVDRMDSV